MRNINPGDAILFERGGYFVGQLNITASGNDNNSLFIGAYGSGNDPVISGSLPLKNWETYKNGIYSAQTDTIVNNLFFNGKQMILARYPNSGYLKITGELRNRKSGFADNKLNQKNGYWNGGNVRVRSNNWAFETRRIKKFSNSTITYDELTKYDSKANWGYYLDNKFTELDAQSEWYFAEERGGKGTAYLIPPSGFDPGKAIIEASFIGIGFFSAQNLTNVIIRDLRFVNQYERGIYFNGRNRNVRIINCTFSGQVLNGIYLPGANRNLLIENCRFRAINGEAMYALNSTKGEYRDNYLTGIGMIPGYGSSGTFGMSGMTILNSDSNLISENFIRYIGHNGINCIGTGNLIEKNVVRHALRFLDDGGAIKSYGKTAAGTIWRNNFVLNITGSLAAAPAMPYVKAYGLYPDAGCSRMSIEFNTIEECATSGIFFNEDCNNNLVAENTMFNNTISIKFRRGDQNSSGNLVRENEMIGFRNQSSVRLISQSRQFIPGTFENNIYFFPSNDTPFQYEASRRLEEFDINDWRNVIAGREINPVVLSGENFVNPEIFRNMTSEQATVLLDPGAQYSDAEGNRYYSSVTIAPWSSEVLFSGTERLVRQELDIAGDAGDLGVVESGSMSAPAWFVICARNLNSDIRIKAPEGFLISTESDRSFSPSLSLSSNANNDETIIYVVFAPKKESGHYGFVEVTSGNLKRLVKVSGSVR